MNCLSDFRIFLVLVPKESLYDESFLGLISEDAHFSAVVWKFVR